MVYDKKNTPGNLVYNLDHALIEKNQEGVFVRQVFTIENRTVIAPGRPVVVELDGGFQIPNLSLGDEKVSIEVLHNNIPEHLRLRRTNRGDYIITSILKPGLYKIIQQMKLTKDSFRFVLPFHVEHGHLYTVPIGMKLEYSQKQYFMKESEVPKENYTLYAISKLPAGKAITVKVSGGTVQDSIHQDSLRASEKGQIVKAAAVDIYGTVMIVFIVAMLFVLRVWYFFRNAPEADLSFDKVVDRLVELENEYRNGKTLDGLYQKQQKYWKKIAIQKIMEEKNFTIR